MSSSVIRLNWRAGIVQFVRQPGVPLLFATIAIIGVGEALAPGFASPGQLIDKLTIAAILAIIAAGQTIVVLAGNEGIDLSVGGVATLGALVAGNVMSGSDVMIVPALFMALLVGAIIGSLNGIGVAVVKIPPLVMTLGMAVVVQGVLVCLTNGITSGSAAPGLRWLVTRPWVFGLPGILFIWLVVAILATFLLRSTRFGLSIYAIGTNSFAAKLAGIRVSRVRILAYVLAGVCSALGGFPLLGYTGVVLIEVGDQYILPSVIAVVLGGTALSGGAGSYIGTVLGAIFLTQLQSVLIIVKVAPQGRQVIFGLTLLFFMLIYGRQKRLRG
jgi:ribose transport system permease protein